MPASTSLTWSGTPRPSSTSCRVTAGRCWTSASTVTRVYWRLPTPPAWSSFGGESRSDPAPTPPPLNAAPLRRFHPCSNRPIAAQASQGCAALRWLGFRGALCVCKWCASTPSTPTATADQDRTLVPCMRHGLLIQLRLDSCKEDTMSSLQTNHLHCCVSLLTVPLA